MKRLKRYAHVDVIITKPAKMNKSLPDRQILFEEAEAISKRLCIRHYTIALDRSGKAYDSEELAERIENLSISHNGLTFIIGGPLGLSETILEKADEILSLSRLTFTHELSRLLLLEQLYRAFTIIHNEKYHK